MKKSRLHSCELKRYRQISAPLCSVCPRIMKCRSFMAWYRLNRNEYMDFVIGICRKFPDKYTMEVNFMAEKQTFVQIVDLASGAIERVVNLTEIEAMTAEDKLALSRNKNLFIVTHRLEPIVRVELKKSVISEPMEFGSRTEPEAQPIEEITPEPIPVAKPRPKKKS
jgi:hypothetical protein